MAHHTINVSSTYYHLFLNPKSAFFWLLVRLYVGYAWLMAGWEKVMDPAWFGLDAGAGMSGFIQGAIAKTAGAHPAVQSWYAVFLQSVVQPHLGLWANAISLGELAVGLGLIVGLFTGVAAFFGAFMNLNFLLAGTTSTNPVLLTLGLGLILARHTAGRIGLDRYARRYIHTFRHPRSR